MTDATLSPWTTIKIKPEAMMRRRLGRLEFWGKLYRNDFWLAYRHAETDAQPDEQPAADPPETVDWARWPLPRSFSSLKISPLMPDRPVVMAPEYPLNLGPQSRAKIYVRCPLWAKLELANSEPYMIQELPAVILSNTWFGTFFEGELAYWLASSARRDPAPDPNRPHACLCPVTIANQSGEPLKVEKICLRVGGLSLFHGDRQLWTDETIVTYRGAKKDTEVEATGKPPSEAPRCVAAASPRDPSLKSFRARSLASLKSLTGLGLFSRS